MMFDSWLHYHGALFIPSVTPNTTLLRLSSLLNRATKVLMSAMSCQVNNRRQSRWFLVSFSSSFPQGLTLLGHEQRIGRREVNSSSSRRQACEIYLPASTSLVTMEA